MGAAPDAPGPSTSSRLAAFTARLRRHGILEPVTAAICQLSRKLDELTPELGDEGYDVIGVVPLGFAIGTSVAIGRVAGAGTVTWGGVLLAAGLAVVALLLQSVLSPFQAAFTELISRRVDGAEAWPLDGLLGH